MPEPTGLREALASVLGVEVVVSKARRLFVFEGVRIHLDRVEGLGDFIEFEGVATDGTDPGDFVALLTTLRTHFAIAEDDLVPHGYSDLSMGRKPAI